MSRKRNHRKNTRAEPTAKSTIAFLNSQAAYDILCCDGYTRLDKNPEVLTACKMIAELVSSMTIHLMSNTDKGDQRVMNELSRKVDITPNRFLTRKTWMTAIVMNLLLHGSGNSVVLPVTSGGILEELIPLDPATVSFIPDDEYGYTVRAGSMEYDPGDVLHFVDNPDPHYPWRGIGITAAVKDVANNLKQAAVTEKGFMESKWKPSVIVKVDGLVDEFSSPAGRKKLLDEYIATNEVGEPWLIPAEQFAIEQIKPLSLTDLAIKDTVELDKKTVASIIGVPAFVLGVGKFDAKEWDNFISTKIRSVAQIIEQELTRKLLISPKWYWKFNIASLYSYDLKTNAEVYGNLYGMGIVDGNEVRDRVSLSPREGLDELVLLENYIPANKIGNQKKLNQEGET